MKKIPMNNLQNRMFFGFIAGFLATLIFHQLVLAILWGLNLAPMVPYNMSGTEPFGVPAVLSLAFWGGLWGIVYGAIDRKFPAGGKYWLMAFLFGAVFPTLVAMLMVLPLKGRPVAGGWNWPLIINAVIINGVWAVGTGVFLKMLVRKFPRGRLAEPHEHKASTPHGAG